MSVATDARRDLIRKLELEKKLVRSLREIGNKIVNQTIRTFAESGNALDVSVFKDELAGVLDTHYQKTADVFASQMTANLPAEIAITATEETLIQESLATYFAARSVDQAGILTATNQREVGRAVQAARETVDDAGQALSRRDQAREAGVRTARKLRGRETTRATTETQHAAEVSKATEAEVLSDRTPSIVRATPSQATVLKEWVTVGDEKVRIDHVRADSQTVDMSKPYTVGGELLRYPGDTSLGASAGNVVNCRCSSVYDASAVFAIRRRKAAEPFVDRTASEQLLESIGF